jgi:NADPH-dependent glutamate synthase beta subunit-like oxidoreductase
VDDQSPRLATLDLVIEPRSERFDDADDRWRSQVSDLYRDLDSEVGGIRRTSAHVAGTKGTVDTVILALGSAGAFTTAVEFLRAWLTRDRSRRLDVSWEVDGGTERVSVSGDAIDGAGLDRIAEAVAVRIEGKPWPRPSTAPS